MNAESEREKLLHQEAGRGAVVSVSGQRSHVLLCSSGLVYKVQPPHLRWH